MNDKDKKLLSKVFSKEELLEIMLEVLTEEKKSYLISKELQNLLALSIEKKQNEVLDEQEKIIRKLSELKVVNLEFFELREQYAKLYKKSKLIEQCMSTIYK